ncbi:MAG TPA: hypothetical protein VFU62_11630 [Hanamia sp.]|nr:hypothetical protein [Hanamia sp.]
MEKYKRRTKNAWQYCRQISHRTNTRSLHATEPFFTTLMSRSSRTFSKCPAEHNAVAPGRPG